MEIDDCLPFHRVVFYNGDTWYLVFSALPRKISYRMFNNLHRLIERAYRGNKWRDNRFTRTEFWARCVLKERKVLIENDTWEGCWLQGKQRLEERANNGRGKSGSKRATLLN